EDPHPLCGRRFGSIVIEIGHAILRRSRSTRLDPPPLPTSASRHLACVRSRAAPAPAFGSPPLLPLGGTRTSYGEQLLLLVLEQLVDLGDDLVGPLLEVLLGAIEVVLADLAVLLEPLELVAGMAAGVADGDPALLGPVA